MKINRLAVSTYFFINGFLYANWTARLPELQVFFNISNTGLGLFLLTIASGAIFAMPFSGWLASKFGTHKITTITAFLFCLAIPLISLSPNHFYLSILFFVIGLASGSMDVAMNGQAVLVERLWKKPIMSSFHAVFSIGMALGAGTGALATKINLDLPIHLSIAASFAVFACSWATFNLIKDIPDSKLSNKRKEPKFVLPTKAILPLGIIAFCAMTGEGAMADWSAIFMNKVVGKDEVYGALAFGSFASSMTIGRLFGDYFTKLWGYKKILIYDSCLAILGLGLAISFSTVWSTLIGFFLVGLGLATIVPIVYSRAGNTPGVSPSVGIAMATTIGYSGFFVGPPVIGFLADWWNLQVGLCFTLCLFVIMLLLTLQSSLVRGK